MERSNADGPFDDAGCVTLSELMLEDSTQASSDFHLLNFNLSSRPSTSTASPSAVPAIPPKQSGRFSRDAIRILKTWLSTHVNRPYPRPDDVQFLQQQTGLDSKQITTWFANARRRGHVRDARPQSAHTPNTRTDPVDIIARPGTPAVQPGTHHTDPLQRWVESPPEHEAAFFGDIVRAVATGADQLIDDGYNSRTLYSSSSASSVGTPYSNAQSDCNSSGSQGSNAPIRKLRNRRWRKSRRSKRSLVTTDLPFQCTFCVETFKTKYDWQRHEKALHLSLEQWTCAPDGPRVLLPASPGELCCVFCGEISPNDAHLETHQYSACQARGEPERSFARKDHLVQHLKLVHKVDLKQVPFDRWKVSMVSIRSRCGFCNLVMDTWSDRVDHLADHFKAGATMSQWQGDWGFEDHILRRVEDSVPPYFNHHERSTPWPLRASDTPTATPIDAYELLKLEVNFFRQNYIDANGEPPDYRTIQFEACRIIFASDALSNKDASMPQGDGDESWLRDLIMCNTDTTTEALFGPLRTASEGVSTLRIYGRAHLFEQCPLEKQLRAFVQARTDMSQTLPDWQIQQEAREIIRRTEVSNTTLEGFSDWVVWTIGSNDHWLSAFKSRAGLLTNSQDQMAAIDLAALFSMESFDRHWTSTSSATDPCPSIEPYTTPEDKNALSVAVPGPVAPDKYSQSHRSMGPNFFRLFTGDLRRWVLATMSPSNPGCHIPTDAEIQHHARWIMYESDDPWNQTAADHPEWLWRFKKDVGISDNAGGAGVLNP